MLILTLFFSFQQMFGNINFFLKLSLQSNFRKRIFSALKAGDHERNPRVSLGGHSPVAFYCSASSFSILIHPCLQEPFPLETLALSGRVRGLLLEIQPPTQAAIGWGAPRATVTWQIRFLALWLWLPTRTPLLSSSASPSLTVRR